MALLLIFYTCLVFTFQQNASNVAAFSAKERVAAFKEINEHLSATIPLANDLNQNQIIRQLESFGQNSASIKSTEFRWLLNELLATLMTLPKELEDCDAAAKAIHRLRDTLSETIGAKELRNYSTKWRLVEIYHLAVGKFDLFCKQRLENNCRTIDREYNSNSLNQLVSKMLTDESKSASLFSPIKGMFTSSSSAAAKKVPNERDKVNQLIKSTESALRNRQKLVNSPLGRDQIKFDQLMQKVLEKIPEESSSKSAISWDNSMNFRANQIRNQCTEFMAKPMTKSYVREAVALVKGAENKETFLSISGEQNSNCFEAMNLYVACEMVKLFTGPLKLVL